MNFLKLHHLIFLSFTSSTNLKGGGVAALFSNDLPFKNISLGIYSTFEYLAFVMKPPNCLMVTIYHPPQHKVGFIPEFGEFLSNVVTNYDFIVICDDFNIHMDNIGDSYAVQFTNQLSMFELTQHIYVPTHNHGHTLDLVISKGLDISVTGTLDVGISDHLCIFFDVALPTKCTSGQRTTMRRNIGEDTPREFITAYTNGIGTHIPANLNPNFSSDFSFESSVSFANCDDLVMSFNASVTQIMD